MAKKTTRKKKLTKKDPTTIESVRHQDKRKNIPTEELRDFVRDEEHEAPPMLYPRDPSLDPQLVWKGKDEQDREPLAVPTVPIYIQEKIHSRDIIEDFRHSVAKSDTDPQLELFSDFNGLPEEFDQRVDFYQHDGNWSNRLILGDSQLVMNSLTEKEGLRGQVQMIYIDPPYGINFRSNWQVSTRNRDVKEKAVDVTRQPEQVRAFRDTWRLGIHSYLAYLRDRLVVANELLSESGSVFVQIGDQNLHLVRSVLDEAFGPHNFCAIISFATTTTTTGRLIPGTSDFLIWYAKDVERVKYHQLYLEKAIGGTGAGSYSQVELPDGSRRRMSKDEKRDPALLPEGARPLRIDNLTSPRVREARTGYFKIDFDGREYLPKKGEWKTNREGIERLRAANRLAATGDGLYYVRFVDDFPAYPLSNVWTDTITAGFASDKRYVVETNTKVLQRCILMTTDTGDLVLDPTCGSGTTAFVAEQWGRRWIAIDSSRVSLTLARTRLMAGRFPFYLLSDSPEGAAKEAEQGGLDTKTKDFLHDIRRGFVYQRVPHITLKSIANNPEIREGMDRNEILSAVTTYGDSEVLLDRPLVDAKRVRVTGPFTVESLSPHRTISVAEKKGRSEHFGDGRALKVYGPDKFGQMIIENLRKAGVQNTKKNERLKFDTVEPLAGEWLHAEGHYTEADGTERRAAICIGPEHGTVGPELLKEAAKEAVKGVGYDVLIVCGFAFDPHVAEEAQRYGNLIVLPCKMNPDLAMGDELLKKTGAGNLFMVFGEPDLDVRTDKDGQVTVEIRGLDVYDPTTGEIRSSSTDDIACWFIDTNYNGESFFVRHAYFTGADEPYDKLKRALRAEVDEDAWSQLYSTTSRPFPKPDTGKIAVKVINHYGDEVLKVYSVT
jgi:adenine-specific DNA-methyltransferase